MKTPKASVIIPVYNRRDLVCKSIDSMLHQTYKDFEIIVVDDGSTDNTREVLEPYITSGKIRYFYQENKGPGAARNKAIKESRGEYIANLDSDDIALPQRLAKQIEVLERNPKVGLVYSDVYIDENKLFTRWNKIHDGIVNKEDMLRHLLFSGCFIVNTTTMYRKKIVEDIPYDENLKIGEDHLFLFEMATKSLFFGINIPLVIVKRDNESLIKDRFLMFNNRIAIIKKLYEKQIFKNIKFNEALSVCYLGIAKEILYSNSINKKLFPYTKAIVKSCFHKFDNIYLYKHLINDLLIKRNLIRIWQ